MSWKANLTRVVVPEDGKPLNTLTDVRAYVLKLDARVNWQHWIYALKLLLEAGEGGDDRAATDQIVLALFLDGKLTRSKRRSNKKPRRSGV